MQIRGFGWCIMIRELPKRLMQVRVSLRCVSWEHSLSGRVEFSSATARQVVRKTEISVRDWAAVPTGMGYWATTQTESRDAIRFEMTHILYFNCYAAILIIDADVTVSRV